MIVVAVGLAWSPAWPQFKNNPTFTTYFAPGVTIEGLTGDNDGNFYVADRNQDSDPNNNCNVWKINTNIPAPNSTKVGEIGVLGCAPSGLTFDRNGDLYITNGSTIYKLTPDENSQPAATEIITNVPGANGVAFDRQGNLLVTDGTENQGRVWKVSPAGGDCTLGSEVNCEEFFRIPPRRNGTALGGLVTAAPTLQGVGSVRFTVPRFNIGAPSDTDRQDIVANGIALSADGKYIFVGDTARGAIWRAELKGNGDLKAHTTGCDPTLTENTLCMDSLYIAHPLLEGVDGIILLTDGTILADANERNAIVAIAPNKTVVDVFQNAADTSDNPADPCSGGHTCLRNGDGTQERPFEFPTVLLSATKNSAPPMPIRTG